MVRLVIKDTVKHAFSGVFGVAFGVVFAMMTGNAKDFYLPGMLYTLGLALAYIITAMAGFPLIGLILGPVFKENLSWRTRNPGRKKAYTKASWAWGLILLAKCAILFPLYWWADTTQLGLGPGRAEDPAVPARRLADLDLPGEGAAADRRVRGDGGGGAGGGGAQGRGAAAERLPSGAAEWGRASGCFAPAAPTVPLFLGAAAPRPPLRADGLVLTPVGLGPPRSIGCFGASSLRTDSRSSSCSSRAWAATNSSSSPASRESSAGRA